MLNIVTPIVNRKNTAIYLHHPIAVDSLSTHSAILEHYTGISYICVGTAFQAGCRGVISLFRRKDSLATCSNIQHSIHKINRPFRVHSSCCCSRCLNIYITAIEIEITHLHAIALLARALDTYITAKNNHISAFRLKSVTSLCDSNITTGDNYSAICNNGINSSLFDYKIYTIEKYLIRAMNSTHSLTFHSNITT